MKKKLIFSFTVFEECLLKRAIQLHLNCLRYFKDSFDEVHVFLLCDDVNDDYEIMDVQNAFLGIGFKDIRFTISKCNIFYESQVFKNEIIDKADKQDALLYFAHTKGVTNYERGFSKPNIDAWIEGLWFFGLCNMNEVNDVLIKDGRFTCIGPFKTQYVGENNIKVTKFEDKFYYSGNFFWVNPMRLSRDLVTYKDNVPNMVDRFFCELFWLDFYDKDIAPHKLTSIGDLYLYEGNPYRESVNKTEFLIGGMGCSEEYTKFKETVEKNLSEK